LTFTISAVIGFRQGPTPVLLGILLRTSQLYLGHPKQALNFVFLARRAKRRAPPGRAPPEDGSDDAIIAFCKHGEKL